MLEFINDQEPAASSASPAVWIYTKDIPPASNKPLSRVPGDLPQELWLLRPHAKARVGEATTRASSATPAVSHHAASPFFAPCGRSAGSDEILSALYYQRVLKS